MAFFGKPKLPEWDPAEGNPHVRPALQMLEAADWAGLAALYRETGPSDRYHLIQGLGALSELDSSLPEETRDPAIGAILGGVRVGWAWRHRGGGRGHEVGESAADGMRRCLLDAEKLLEPAGDAAPEDSTLIAWSLRCEMGLGGDYNTLTKLTHRLAHSPEANIFAALAHLNFVAPKWHGSMEEMWAAANAYAGKPHNAAWVVMAARAHVEEYLFSYEFGDDPERKAAYGAQLRDPEFRAFIGTIDKLFWDTLDEKGPMSGSETVFAHNGMAAALVMVNAIDLSRAHFERMGPYITEQPLGYFGWTHNPIQALNMWRKRASLPPIKA